MLKNKKGIIQFGIIAIAIAIIVVGVLAFNPFKAKATGLTPEEVKATIDKEKTSQKQETQQPSITCGTGTILQGGSCIVANNGQTPSAAPNLPPSELKIPAGSSQPCNAPSGQFTRLYYRQRNLLDSGAFGFNTAVSKADVLGVFKNTGNCPLDIYVEAGINAQPQSASPLAIHPSGFFGAVKGQPSACDGNVNYNGVMFKQVQPNAIVIFELQPENYGAEGSYWIDIGAHTGCIKDGGATITSKRGLVGFSNKYQVNTGDLNKDIHMSWVQLV